MRIGVKQGRLMPLERLHGAKYLVHCDCGEDAVVAKNATSCGCYRREVNKALHTIDGRASHPLYGVWKEMIARCHRESHRDYHYYGQRGIRVCYGWRRSFAQFLNDMGPRPEGMTIERRNNDDDYEPKNCYWATWSEQAYNRRAKGTA